MTASPSTAPIINAMTIDVEEYYHANVFDDTPARRDPSRLESRVRASTERMLSLLDDAGVRATFFVLGAVADAHPMLVNEIAARGHEIASHGYAHQIVYGQSPAAFRDDVRRAKDVLQSRAGVAVRGYRAPSYSITKQSLWALDILRDEGYHYDASIFPIRHDRYGIPEAPRHPFQVLDGAPGLIEAPSSTVRIGSVNLPVAGGGYFRLLPYGWTRWGIERLNSVERRPAIFYTHPWEIDGRQPRLPLSRVSALRHYANLNTTITKLARLLNDFRFGPLGEMLDRSRSLPSAASLGWSSAAPSPAAFR